MDLDRLTFLPSDIYRFSWRQVNHILNIFLPMSHSRLDSRRSNYLDAVHSCRISLATSNQFTYFIQQGHSVYRIHVQQKKIGIRAHQKHMVQLKKVITVALKVIHRLRIHFQHRGGVSKKIIRP